MPIRFQYSVNTTYTNTISRNKVLLFTTDLRQRILLCFKTFFRLYEEKSFLGSFNDMGGITRRVFYYRHFVDKTIFILKTLPRGRFVRKNIQGITINKKSIMFCFEMLVYK